MNAISIPTNAVREYAEAFAAHPPDILKSFSSGAEPIFPFPVESDRGLGILLLCAALYRPGLENGSYEIVRGLFREFSLDVFKLNRIPFEDLQKALSHLPQSKDSEEQNRVPGILRSVGDFFFHRGGLLKWLEASEDWESCGEELSREIFWMGKRSRLRTKARFFFWLASFQPEFDKRFAQARKFQWPIVPGHTRFYQNILGLRTRIAGPTPEARLHWFSRFALEVFPDQPWRLFAPLDAYLRPEKKWEYACRRIQGGCRPCPLSARCPAAQYFVRDELKS